MISAVLAPALSSRRFTFKRSSPFRLAEKASAE